MRGAATILSLAGLSLAAASMPLSISGYIDTSLRLLFLSYLMDVLDGWVARRLGESSSEGYMLDRAIDRVSQVIAPLVLYTSWVTDSGIDPMYLAALVIYSAAIVAIAFYRLIYRRVTSLAYFYGLPMFFHAGILITSTLTGHIVEAPILFLGAALSILPIRYYRRGRTGGPSPAVAPRAALVLLLALIPYDWRVVVEVARLIYFILVAYMIIGPIAYYMLARGKPGSTSS